MEAIDKLANILSQKIEDAPEGSKQAEEMDSLKNLGIIAVLGLILIPILKLTVGGGVFLTTFKYLQKEKKNSKRYNPAYFSTQRTPNCLFCTTICVTSPKKYGMSPQSPALAPTALNSRSHPYDSVAPAAHLSTRVSPRRLSLYLARSSRARGGNLAELLGGETDELAKVSFQ
eukprot:7797502-Pyramimonas_sp.AAC.1